MAKRIFFSVSLLLSCSFLHAEHSDEDSRSTRRHSLEVDTTFNYHLVCSTKAPALKIEARLPIDPNRPGAGAGLLKLKNVAKPIKISCNPGPTDIPPENTALIWQCYQEPVTNNSYTALVFAKGFPPKQKTWATIKKGNKIIAKKINCE